MLIPAPYYPAFDNDLKVVGGAACCASASTPSRLPGVFLCPHGGQQAVLPLAWLALPCSNCCPPVLQAKCCVHPLPVHLAEGGSNGGGGLRQQLDAAAAEAAGRGIPVRGLLVTNPNNPLGTIYSDESLLEMLGWCLDNKVHYIRYA